MASRKIGVNEQRTDGPTTRIRKALRLILLAEASVPLFCGNYNQ